MARRALVLREPSTEQGTFGRLYLLDAEGTHDLDWDSLELPWKENRTGISCVLPGIYTAKLVYSNHFQRMVYLFEGIPDRTAVEMHPANWAGDEALGWHSDLRGCVAIGNGRGELAYKGKPQAAILHSKDALDQFIEATGGEDIEVQFEWDVPQAA